MGAAEAVVEDPINQWKQQPTRNRGRASKGKGTTISTAFVSTEKAESEAGRAEARKAEASPILVDPEKSSKGRQHPVDQRQRRIESDPIDPAEMRIQLHLS